MAVSTALKDGIRGLPGDSSLARLFAVERGVRNPAGLPAFSEDQILAWADAFRARTGRWPRRSSGTIEEAPGETWGAVEDALIRGLRGLDGQTSLAQLLARHRGIRHRANTPSLALETILAWADAHHARTGTWPTVNSGPIPEAPGETWGAVGAALQEGRRGLPVRMSLARLLEEERQRDGRRDHLRRRPFCVDEILSWADAYFARTGNWPTRASGSIAEAPGETWAVVGQALRRGTRGLTPGSSLSLLLAEHRGKRHPDALPPLAREAILRWAATHRERHGRPPSVRSGPIEEAPGETWLAVHNALKSGARGLPGGTTLARFLGDHR
jgi:hypothetical protein